MPQPQNMSAMTQRRTSSAPSMAGAPEAMGPRKRRDFFVYRAFVAGPIAAGGTAADQVQIQADSAFEIQKLTMFADIADAAQTEESRVLPLVTVQITDTGTGRQLFAEAVSIPALFGDGRFPFILPTTKLLSPSSVLSFDFANYSAATPYSNLQLLLIGTKIFDY